MLLQSLLRPVLTPLMRGMFDAPIASSSAWSPLSLWPDGIATPGMWISPRTLTSEWQDYAGTTPVATPGTVADTSNPVGLALDIRAGAPDVLGPELVTNGTFDSGISGWTAYYLSPTLSWDSGNHRIAVTGNTWCTATTPFSVTAGKTYLLSATLAGTDPAIWFGTNGSTTVGERLLASGQSIYTAASSGTLYAVIQGCGPDGSTAYFDNISVREVPGNHMLQSTSAARPLMSARVNLLTYTEDFSNPAWLVNTTSGTGAVAKTPNYSVAPDGSTTACRVVASRTGADYALMRQIVTSGRPINLVSAWLKSNTGVDQVIVFGSSSLSFEVVTVTSTWTRIPGAIQSPHWSLAFLDVGVGGASDNAIDVSIWHPQLEFSAEIHDYQSVPGDGSTYATAFPIFQLYDGVDDGMATAAFTAGTLIDGMDCMIAVRLDSAAACVAGLYNGIADATKFFGMAESASGSGCVGSGAGTPTVWVDNAQLTGGTAVTRGTLHTALTVGDYHILEFRGLDLSTWTAAGFGLYTSYVFPGPRGDIFLFPSTASTEDKDAARQYLADYYGVTLP
jgi:hypothetical protein